MSQANELCACGKKRNELNNVNWNRHVSSCKVMKRKNLDNFFDISIYFNKSRRQNSLENDCGSEAKKGKISLKGK